MLALRVEHYAVETRQACEKYPAFTMDCEIFLQSVVKNSAAATFGRIMALYQRQINPNYHRAVSGSREIAQVPPLAGHPAVGALNHNPDSAD
jgi:hypothetical protein